MAALLTGTKLPIPHQIVSGRITAPTINATDINVSGSVDLARDNSTLTIENIQAPPNNNINVNGYVKVSESILAPMATFGDLVITKSVSGLDKTKVGFDKVDNTADVNTPISTATQTELKTKENLFNVIAPLKNTC